MKCQDYYAKCKHEISTWTAGYDCNGSKKGNFLASNTAALPPEGKTVIEKNYNDCCNNLSYGFFNKDTTNNTLIKCYCETGTRMLKQANVCSGTYPGE
jgi:hypothetical protein